MDVLGDIEVILHLHLLVLINQTLLFLLFPTFLFLLLLEGFLDHGFVEIGLGE